MLEIRALGAALGGRPILEQVSLTLRPGRVTVLLGPNGSGKSTLIRCVNQQVRYTGGILLDGRDLRALTPRERASRIAILPQVLPRTSLTVRELAGLGRNPYVDFTGRMSAKDRAAVDWALERADVAGMAARRCDSLSGGERQRAFLAMMLAQEADILLLDEPTAWLDIGARRALRDMILRLAHEEGHAVLAVLHDLNEAVRLADELAVLREGRVAFSGSVRRFLEEEAAERLFGVRRYDCAADGEKAVFFE